MRLRPRFHGRKISGVSSTDERRGCFREAVEEYFLSLELRRAGGHKGSQTEAPLTYPDCESWFVEQVLPNERQLRRYLGRFLSQPADVADVVQEAYARMIMLSELERDRIRSVKAFLLRTARNVVLDRLRQQQVVSLDVMLQLDEGMVIDDGPTAYEEISVRQELALLSRALASLPERCRQVLTLRKVFGVSQREISARLQISENTVETHIANGMRLCAARLFALQEGEHAPSREHASRGPKRRGTRDVR